MSVVNEFTTQQTPVYEVDSPQCLGIPIFFQEDGGLPKVDNHLRPRLGNLFIDCSCV